MPRYFLTVEYDGTPYVGWQRQDNGKSVQGVIEKAILDATGETVTLAARGARISGVHGLRQVSHCDLSKPWRPYVLRNALNAHLQLAEERVSILEAAEVAEQYDSRFSAPSGIISIASSTARPVGRRGEQGVVGEEASRPRGDACGRATACRAP